MKKMYKVLALVLALMMLVSVLAACGEKKDDSKSSDTASQADNGDNGGSGSGEVAGAEQTWGNLTVFVPDTMDFKGGDGTYDPDDENTAWLYNKAKATDYIKLRLVESEEIAKDSVDTTKEFNQSYDPTDVTIGLDNSQWEGVTYNASGTTCLTAYATIGGKVYIVMEAGFETDDEALYAVLNSLK